MDKEYARRLLAGEIPMENPRIKKPGDPAYYYFDPRGVTEHTKFKDRKLIGVPTADTPNPALVDKQTQFSLNNKFNNNGIKYAQNENMHKTFDKMMQNEGMLTDKEIADRTRNSHIIDFNAAKNIVKNFVKYRPLALNDKYKHAMTNCEAAQKGTGGSLISGFLSGLKEIYDIKSKNNTLYESYEDNKANEIGRYLGYKYPNGDCDEMVRQYIKKK